MKRSGIDDFATYYSQLIFGANYSKISCISARNFVKTIRSALLHTEEWKAITVEEMTAAQESDQHCQGLLKRKEEMACYEVTADGVFVHFSAGPRCSSSRPNVVTIESDGAIPLHSFIFSCSDVGQHPKCAGHPGGEGRCHSSHRKARTSLRMGLFL